MNTPFIYFLKNFQLFYNVRDVDLGYGDEQGKAITVRKNCEDSFWLEKKDVSASHVVWKEWNGISIPFLFEKNNEHEIITFKGDKAVIHYDIIAAAVYFLSGWNEYVNPSRDEFGRVKYETSIIKYLGITTIPVVNYYYSILEEAITKVYKRNIKKDVWDTKTFAVALTHDIDTCQSCWLEGSFSEIKKKRILSVPGLIFNRIFKDDDWFNFRKIVQLEKKYNATSSFYFLPRKGKAGRWTNADYNIKGRKIQQTISFLQEQGADIGVHGSFGAHADKTMLNDDILRIRSRPVTGNRFHYLLFDPEKTVSVLEDCHIKYDTTIGFAENMGFRRATCYPFYLYAFERNVTSPVLEIPLTVMDTSMANKRYMGLTKEEARTRVHQIINEVRKFNGVFTLLWHNTYFSDYKYTGWREVYSDILEYCSMHNGLLTNGKNVYDKITGS